MGGLSLRIFMPSGATSGLLCAWTERVADFMVARAPVASDLMTSLDEEILDRPAVAVRFEQDGGITAIAVPALREAKGERPDAAICHPGNIYRADHLTMSWPSAALMAGLARRLAAGLGGEALASSCEDEPSAAEADRIAPIIAEMLKAVAADKLDPPATAPTP